MCISFTTEHVQLLFVGKILSCTLAVSLNETNILCVLTNITKAHDTCNKEHLFAQRAACGGIYSCLQFAYTRKITARCQIYINYKKGRCFKGFINRNIVCVSLGFRVS